MKGVRRLGKHWVSRVRSNRKVLWRGRRIKLSKMAKMAGKEAFKLNGRKVFSDVVFMESLGDFVKLVIIYDRETVFLATSQLGMSLDEVFERYIYRWLWRYFMEKGSMS